MKVTDLHVDGFGVWTEKRLSDLSSRVTIVFGANETGKTTLMQFMRTVLYGFSPERRNRYLPPVSGGRPGGALDVHAERGRMRVSRHLDRYGLAEEQEQLAVRAADGAVLSPSVLDHLLLGVDEPTFNNVFAVGLRELQELGTLDDTKAADLLYKLTTGLDRVSLVDVMRDLGSIRDQLLDPGGQPCRIMDLQQRRDRLRGRVDELGQRCRQWLDLEERLTSLHEEVRELEDRISELGAAEEVVEVALQVHDLWCQRGVLHRQLEALGPIQEVPEGSLERLDQLRQVMDDRQRQIGQLKRRRREIRRAMTELPLNEELWSQAPRIEALAEHGPWIASLQSQVHQLRLEVHGKEAQLTSSAAGVGRHEEALPDDLPDLTRRTLATLRAPARAVREESQRLKQAEDELELARLQADEMTVQLETALLDRGQTDLTEAVETAGSTAQRLRRRVQLDERLDALSRQCERLQQDHHELLQDQVLSLSTLAWLGVPFVIGVMLVLGGMVWSSAAVLGWPVATLGLAGWAIAVIAKVALERSAAQELEQCEKQLELLQSQTKQAKQEQTQLDEQLPRSAGSLDGRLASADKDLARFEELLPLEANLQATRQRVQSLQRRVDQLDAAVKESRARWRSALRHCHLPENLSPQAVRQLAQGNERTRQFQRHLQRRRDELAAREQELTALTLRVEEMMEQVKLTSVSDDPQDQLQRLTSALAQQQQLAARRQGLSQEDRQIQRQGRKLVKELRRARAQCRATVAEAGAADEKELRHMSARVEQRQAMEQECEEVSGQFLRALGSRCDRESVERELVDHAQTELEQRRHMLAQRLSETRAQLAAIHQQRGAVAQESKTLIADRQLADVKLELGCVEQQLAEAVHRWRVLAVSAQVLETVRQIYETHRQPQTLKDASRYFEALTEGQYVRIWTPLTDMALRVDTVAGDALPLDVLSCGTREAVFLSLRLALVVDFSRRGVVLPLVLDDVLVNFDSRRAKAAADVLCRFADSGHQVLMFTCHEHIVQLFEAAHVEIRYLSEYAPATRHVVIAPAEPVPAEVLVIEPPEVEVAEEEYELEEAEIVDDEEDYDEIEYELEDEEEVLEPETPDYLLDVFEEAEVEEAEVDDLDDDEDYEEEDEVDEEEEYDEDEEEDEEEDEDDEEEEEHDEVDQCDDDEQEVPFREVAEHADERRQRFTWESPERWWDVDHNGGAAA